MKFHITVMYVKDTSDEARKEEWDTEDLNHVAALQAVLYDLRRKHEHAEANEVLCLMAAPQPQREDDDTVVNDIGSAVENRAQEFMRDAGKDTNK
jgi:hypothetical protein